MAQNIGLHRAVKQTRPLYQRIGYALRKPQTIDELMLVVAVVLPFTLLPQIIKIIDSQDASSISVESLVLRILFAFPWIYYGRLHKSTAIVLTNVLWAIGHSIILVQTQIY